MPRSRWTDERIEEAKRAIAETGSVRGAARKLGIDPVAILTAFQRRGLDALVFVKGIDPVERAVRRENESRLKREHGELVQQLRDAREREEILLALRDVPPPAIEAREKSRKSSNKKEATAQLCISDVHAAEVVTPEQVSGRNEFNLAICERRLGRTFGAGRWLIEFHRQGFLIREAILWLGGDLISGRLHDENVETDELSPTETVVWLMPRIEQGIETLLADPGLERLIVVCSYGNHGRTTHKIRRSTGAANSYEFLMYTMLAQRYANNPRVVFVVTPSAHQFVDVYDWTNHYHHGDEVRSWGGVGGLSIPLNKRVPKWENVRAARYHHIGHFHTFFDLGHTLGNGSIKGYDAYAYSIGADYEDPQQAFCLYVAGRGKSQVSPIWSEGDKWTAQYRAGAA
jgi:hypothetical protein